MNILIIQPSALGDIIYTLYTVKLLHNFLKKNFVYINIDWFCKIKNNILENQIEIRNIIGNKYIIRDKYNIIIDFGTKTDTLYLKYKIKNGIKIGFYKKEYSIKKKLTSFFNDYNIFYDDTVSTIKNQNKIIKLIMKITNKDIYLNKNHIDSYNFEKINITLDYPNNLDYKLDKKLSKNGMDIKDKYICFNPNSSKKNKELSVKEWIKIYEFCKNECNYNKFILIGSNYGEKGRELKDKINKFNYNILILPDLNLLELGLFLKKYCRLLISVDTSIYHLAEFQKVKTLGIFFDNIHSKNNMVSWGNKINNLVYNFNNICNDISNILLKKDYLS